MAKKVGIICEGGGTKAAYTSGVLKAFLDNHIYLPYCVGISAGIENLMPYVSRQPQRLEVTGIESASNPGAVGIRPLIKEGQIFGLQETVDFIEKRVPFDFDAFFKSDTQLDVGLYNLNTGKIEYFGKEYMDKEQTLTKAACALALLTKPYHFNGGLYMDAGLIDMIPIEQSVRAGCDKHIYISTKEPDYVRKPAPAYQVKLAKLIYRKYPHVAYNLKLRHVWYADQKQIVSDLTAQGKAMTLAPSRDLGVSRYTTDRTKIEPWYWLGYNDTVHRLDLIKRFIEE